jgi:hypothetical protein
MDKHLWTCDERDRANCRNSHGCHCREITAQAAALAEARERVEGLERVLEFYADPHKFKDEYGQPVPVPDFYRELDFGDRALAALPQAAPGQEG